MNSVIAIGIIICCLILGLMVVHYINSGNVELVEADPNDPAVKKILDERNSLISSIFEHLTVNLNMTAANIEQTCEVLNLDEKHTVVKVASGDIICTLVFTWNRRVKMILFRNKKLRGKTIQRRKIFRVKNNNLDTAKLTKFLVHFKKIAIEEKLTVEKLMSSCLAISSALTEKMSQDELVDLLIQATLDFSLQDYKNPKDGSALYVALLAFLQANYKEELTHALEEDIKEP